MAILRSNLGTYNQLSLDPLSKAKLIYSIGCTKHLTGLEASSSVIVRAALEMYSNKLESLLPLPKDDEHIHMLRRQLISASEGAPVPWDYFPSIDSSKVYPALSALLKAHSKGHFDFLKYPIRGNRDKQPLSTYKEGNK